MAETLVIGIGNTIRGDDAIGIHMAREIARDKPGDIDVVEIETSGFELLDLMRGYKRVIIIDAMPTADEEKIGNVGIFRFDNRPGSATLLPSHGIDFAGIVTTFRQLEPESIPRDIYFLLVSVKDVNIFKEELSVELAERYTVVLDSVRSHLTRLLKE